MRSLVLSLMLVALCGCEKPQQKPQAQKPIPKEIPGIQSAEDVAREFYSNRVGFDGKYNGNNVRIGGVVMKIDHTKSLFRGKQIGYSVALATNLPNQEIRCFFGVEHKQAIEHLKVGDVIVVKGFDLNENNFFGLSCMAMSNCVIEPVPSNVPAGSKK